MRAFLAPVGGRSDIIQAVPSIFQAKCVLSYL